MARSVSALHKEYKARGGTKSFVEFRKATAAKARSTTAPKAATAKAKKAKAMVSGKLEKNLRKPIKRKYST